VIIAKYKASDPPITGLVRRFSGGGTALQIKYMKSLSAEVY
jgi:hypothetical protein